MEITISNKEDKYLIILFPENLVQFNALLNFVVKSSKTVTVSVCNLNLVTIKNTSHSILIISIDSVMCDVDSDESKEQMELTIFRRSWRFKYS